MTVRVLNIKVVIIGDGRVGKTSLVQRYMGYGFNPQYLRTIGANFYSKRFDYEDERIGKLAIQLIVWDLAGQPYFNEVREQYYRGAKVAIAVFDVTCEESFKNIKNWINEFWKNIGEKYPIVLVGNKTDLRETMEGLSPEKGKELAEKYSQELGLEIPYIETSAKTGENVEKVFQYAVKLVLDYLIRKLKK